MRQISIFAIAVLVTIGTSCKKDFEIDETLEQEIFQPEFFVRGKIIDNNNDEEIDFAIETTEDEDGALDYNPEFVAAKSTLGIQSDTQKKFIAASTGKDAGSIFGLFPNTTELEVMLWVQNSIVVKIVTDHDAGDELDSFGEKFTKEELLEILEAGRVLPFGTDPFEVEVSFHHPNVEGYPEFSTRGFHGLSTWHPDNITSSVEILSIEDYYNPQQVTQEKAILVKAKINCRLRSADNDFMELEDVEVMLMFTYE